MKRRIWILALVLVMALQALPMGAAAAAEDVHTELYNRTRKSYTSSLASYGKSSFHGYCATLVAYQLRYNGITKRAELCNGNEMYDRYKNQERSSGGYYIYPYSAKKYSLEQTLNVLSENGTKDVYNILLGFQWTNTSAGRKYGHTVFINGILDGTVYFTESFSSNITGKEGQVARLSISKFAKFYDSWTRYEGAIHFTRQYADACARWETDLFVRAQQALQLTSQPCPVGEEDSVLLRSINAGERLWVSAVVQGWEDQWFYRVQDGEYIGYMPAQATTVEQFNGENAGVTDFQMPMNIQPHEVLELSGEATAAGTVKAVEAVVTNASGLEVTRVEQERASLADLELPQLPADGYTLTVSAEVACAYVDENGLAEAAVSVRLLEEPFWVGPMVRTDHLRMIPAVNPVTDGWFKQNGQWYYYENGQPYTGWLWEQGIRYYLNENGAVTTGWATIDGQTCLFSSTGALCTGWIRVAEGMRYCSYEGRFANGWMNIDGVRYYFEEGLMQTEGTVTDGMEVYRIEPNGQAVVLTEE